MECSGGDCGERGGRLLPFGVRLPEGGSFGRPWLRPLGVRLPAASSWISRSSLKRTCRGDHRHKSVGAGQTVGVPCNAWAAHHTTGGSN